MQPISSQGVSGRPPTQPDAYFVSGPSSMQAGAAGALQSSLAPGVYIYGETQPLPGQPSGNHGAPATSNMNPNQVNWNASHMYYQQHRYCSTYRWRLFANQYRHKATVWHRVRFVQPKTFCPECFTPRVLDSDDEDSQNDSSTNLSQGVTQRRQCVRRDSCLLPE
jgi:hypothetical protein